MYKILIYFFLLIFLTSCKNTPVDSGEERPPKIGANLGEDQISYVGSYAVLDASQSILPEGEIFSFMTFFQDSSNPRMLNLFGRSNLLETLTVGFEEEGIYEIEVEIKCESENIYRDTVIITALPRQTGLIEDVNLEITIRHRLNFPVGDLNDNILSRIDSLSTANLPLNKINSLAGIQYCVNAKYLLLSRQNISDLHNLSNLIKLEYLNLNQNRVISDISPLGSLINLEKLILYSNAIEDINALGNLINLKYLDLNWIPITNINPLSNLTSLEVLYISGVGTSAALDNVQPLEELVNLKQLSLSGRWLTDIQPLEDLTELVYLDLSFNQINTISAISPMHELERLEIRKNKIENLTGLKDLNKLEYLDAADNEITDISDLQYLGNIYLIGLARNNIEDLLPLVNNSNLGEGVHLFIGSNPLNEKSINEYIPILEARGVIVNM